MLEAYSVDATLTANSAIPFFNVTLEKGTTAVLQSPSTIALNKCGVYMVSVNGTFSASTTIQLYKDGVAQPQAQMTGEAVSFMTLVQVDKNNSNCCCSSPTRIQVQTTAAGTGTYNVVVTKVC